MKIDNESDIILDLKRIGQTAAHTLLEISLNISTGTLLSYLLSQAIVQHCRDGDCDTGDKDVILQYD